MTIYDIAKEAGVSASTVSRVVNKKPGIREETRARVMAVIEKYNFAPDETARGLVRQASKTIGLLIADISISNYMRNMHSIIRMLGDEDYCCIVMNTGLGEEERAEYVKLLSQRRVEGAVLIGAGYQCDEVRRAIELYLKDVPVIMVNAFLDLPNVYGVMMDERKGAELCFDRLFELGYKRPAYVGCGSAVSNMNKQAGLRDSVEKNAPGLEVPVYISHDHASCGEPETLDILEKYPETDVIYYSADYFAVAGMRKLQELGKSVPEDMAVITGEESAHAMALHPFITALDTRVDELCRIAARELVDVLNGGSAPHKVVVQPELIERETTRKV